ncbi:MAG: peptidase M64 [Bacteroidales bacterium]|nr:peptidase M64 [Bacteroidales bacterium]
MKSIVIHFMFLSTILTNAQSKFDKYFTGERLRFDYMIAGNFKECNIYTYQFYKEPYWGGSEINLIDTFMYGEMLIEIYDSISDELIYSRGYSTLFKEWQTVGESRLTQRAFLESVVVPFPAKAVKIVIYDRKHNLQFRLVYTTFFNPDSRDIICLKQPLNAELKQPVLNGDPSVKLDLVIVAEGYTTDEKEKFFEDAGWIAEIIFEWQPYNDFKSEINVYSLFIPSDESGTDLPQDSLWLNTAFNTTFNTFGSERYLTSKEMSLIRDAVSDVPYDQICIMVNSEKYGGGGVYNYFTVFSSSNEYSEFLFHHELGHAFAGLADEYYTSEVEFDTMFSLKYEPYQPNITTLIDFKSKWESMVHDSVPIPTPDTSYWQNVLGVFEGAGYSEKGVYRPTFNCSMKSVVNDSFCPVCRKAIGDMIRFYTRK